MNEVGIDLSARRPKRLTLEMQLHRIREDRRQHQMRMQQLVPGLVTEFGERREDEEIRRIADEILDTHEEVPVRSFVMTLANRRARAILKERTATPA